MLQNRSDRRVRRHGLLLGAAATALLMSGGLAWADPGADAPTATADPGSSVNELVVVAQAVHVSPSAVPVNQTQPTSRIQKEFIQNNIIPLASFDDIVKFSPSVWDQSPNGPGLGKSETLSIRGFQDGQFNVTFDGIPFGDATDFHHTSSALFIAHDIGEAQIDRGPGTASTIGDATFGGSMNFVTKDPLNELTLNPYGTVGSYDTYSGGVEVDSGQQPWIGKGYLDFQDEDSNGYLTGATEQRWNVMFKDVAEITSRLTVTALASYNHAFEYTTQGTTLANIQAFGPNFALTDNPKTQAYYAYQPSDYSSDFDYIDLKAKITDTWTLDDKVYTDSFGHFYTEGSDASDTDPSTNKVSFYNDKGASISAPAGASKTDVPGKYTWAYFRAIGDILRLTDDLPFGELQFGVWAERNNDKRYSYNVDLTDDSIPTGTKSGTIYSYFIYDSLTTIQPYVEFDWHVTPNFTVTPGVRYSDFIRDYDAPVNKAADVAGKHVAADYSQSYTSLQPSISARYTITPGWSAYAQVARGFLAPPINVLEVNTAAAPAVKPEETWNYQIGTDLRQGRWILGLDGYYIDFSNFITSPPTVNGITTYVNGGGAIYEGVEFEGQYVLDGGFSLYGNATYNRARYTEDPSVWIAEAPEYTAAAGILYDDRRGPYASLIAKDIGPRYGLDVPLSGVGLGDSFHFGSYVTADLAAGWRFRNLPHMKDFTASVKVSNLFDNRALDDYAGQQSATSAAFPYGAPLFWTIPGRSVFVNLSASF